MKNSLLLVTVSHRGTPERWSEPARVTTTQSMTMGWLRQQMLSEEQMALFVLLQVLRRRG